MLAIWNLKLRFRELKISVVLFVYLNIKATDIYAHDGVTVPPTTGGGVGRGGHGPSTSLQKNAIPKFVDNRYNSL